MVDKEQDTPIDPTALTTAALIREIAGLDVNLRRALESAQIVIETRLDGMDKAIELLQSTADKFPARMDEKISSLQKVHDEKFESIEKQFKERDTRTEQTSKDSKVAVDAALQAQKEAAGAQNESNAASITKSEAAFTKQIDQMGLLIQNITKAFDDKIDDLKERLSRAEGSGEGINSANTTHRAISGQMIAFVSVLLGLAGLVFGIIMAVRR